MAYYIILDRLLFRSMISAATEESMRDALITKCKAVILILNCCLFYSSLYHGLMAGLRSYPGRRVSLPMLQQRTTTSMITPCSCSWFKFRIHVATRYSLSLATDLLDDINMPSVSRVIYILIHHGRPTPEAATVASDGREPRMRPSLSLARRDAQFTPTGAHMGPRSGG